MYFNHTFQKGKQRKESKSAYFFARPFQNFLDKNTNPLILGKTQLANQKQKPVVKNLEGLPM